MARIVQYPKRIKRIQPINPVQTPVGSLVRTAVVGRSLVKRVKRILGSDEGIVERPKDQKPWGTWSWGDVVERPISVKNKRAKPRIHFINLDSDPEQVLTLPWVPESVSMDPASQLAAIPSIGRNTPFYHYTGGEDTLEFVIDWFFTDDYSRSKALVMATTLESFSKSNGYQGNPPRLKLVWGQVFKNSIWLLEYAPYTLEQWAHAVKLPDFNIRDHDLLPQQIKQEVKLRRISQHNLISEDIIYKPESDYISEPFLTLV